MKKFVFFILFIILPQSFSFSSQIWWSNPEPDYWVDRFTNTISSSSGWLVAMCNAGDNSVIYSRTNGWYSIGPTSGYFYVNINTQGTFNVYTRIYDNSSIGSATWCSDIGPVTNRTLDAIDPPWGYYLPANAAGDWVLIPEPGTITLFALGLITMAVKRRLINKKR